MPCDWVIVVAPIHLHMAYASSQDILLRSVVQATVVLLPIILILAKQRGWNAMFLSQKPTWEAQSSPGLFCSVVFCKTFANEVK